MRNKAHPKFWPGVSDAGGWVSPTEAEPQGLGTDSGVRLTAPTICTNYFQHSMSAFCPHSGFHCDSKNKPRLLSEQRSVNQPIFVNADVLSPSRQELVFYISHGHAEISLLIILLHLNLPVSLTYY